MRQKNKMAKSSGRVTMDYLMKLLTTALEWSYQAREPPM